MYHPEHMVHASPSGKINVEARSIGPPTIAITQRSPLHPAARVPSYPPTTGSNVSPANLLDPCKPVARPLAPSAQTYPQRLFRLQPGALWQPPLSELRRQRGAVEAKARKSALVTRNTGTRP